MKVRLPKGNSGMGNIQSLAQQAQKVQQEMQDAAGKLEEKTYETSVGGGVVKIVINGKLEIVSLNIDPEIVNNNDVDMLSDLIISGVNEIIKKANKDRDEVMEKISGKMNIPGMF